MRITFINPNFTNRRSYDAMEPVVYAILAAYTPSDVEKVFYDERIEEIQYDDQTDLVVLSVQTFTARRAYRIASEYRKRKIPVVLGGIHPTLMPNETRSYCDAVAVGEAENLWPRIVNDAREGNLKPIYYSQPSSQTLVTHFDRSIFKGKRYNFLKPVQFGRGCRFNCDFCCVHVLYKNMTRNRLVEDMIAEIKSLSSSYIFFVDDNLIANFADFRALMKEMIPLNKHFGCQISIDAAVNEGTVSLLKNAGCMAVFIGFESFIEDSLNQMGKGVNRFKSYSDVVKRFNKQGIMVIGSFIFGYDHDSPGSIQSAYDFAMLEKLCSAHFNMLFPFPGTRLYDRLERENKLVFKKWWTDKSCTYSDCLFYPENMKPEELKALCQATRKKFNSLPSIAYRSLNLSANARNIWNYFAFWGTNLVSRKEIKNKLMMEMG